ncbi:MAG: hypothetical protein ABSG68_26565, partial [Thermoguttaceae bacterium]
MLQDGGRAMMTIKSRLFWLAMVLLLGGLAARPGSAQVSTPPGDTIIAQPGGMSYDGLQAGRDAYGMAEEQRQAAIDRQLGLKAEIHWYHPWPAISVYRYPYYAARQPTG